MAYLLIDCRGFGFGCSYLGVPLISAYPQEKWLKWVSQDNSVVAQQINGFVFHILNVFIFPSYEIPDPVGFWALALVVFCFWLIVIEPPFR